MGVVALCITSRASSLPAWRPDACYAAQARLTFGVRATMRHMLLIFGSTLLTFCLIWAYLWLEVLSDPKNELKNFYVQNPSVHKSITVLHKTWLPALLLGAAFIAVALFIH